MIVININHKYIVIGRMIFLLFVNFKRRVKMNSKFKKISNINSISNFSYWNINVCICYRNR